MLDVAITTPMYLSPGIVVGCDPSGQLVVIFKKGEPDLKHLELIDRAVKLCDLEYLGDPYHLDGKWCCKLKQKELGDG